MGRSGASSHFNERHIVLESLPVDGRRLVIHMGFEVGPVKAVHVNGGGWPAGCVEDLGQPRSQGGFTGARTAGYRDGVHLRERHGRLLQNLYCQVGLVVGTEIMSWDK